MTTPQICRPLGVARIPVGQCLAAGLKANLLAPADQTPTEELLIHAGDNHVAVRRSDCAVDGRQVAVADPGLALLFAGEAHHERRLRTPNQDLVQVQPADTALRLGEPKRMATLLRGGAAAAGRSRGVGCDPITVDEHVLASYLDDDKAHAAAPDHLLRRPARCAECCGALCVWCRSPRDGRVHREGHRCQRRR